MKRALVKLVAPVVVIVVGVLMMTLLDWDIGGWIAFAGLIAFAVVAWWASVISDPF